MGIYEDLQEVCQALSEQIVDKDKDIGLTLTRVEDWLESPSCSLVPEDELL